MLQTTKQINGFKCYIKMMDSGHLCGYVVIPKNNKFYKVKYDNIFIKEPCDIEVHGGLTYSELDKDTDEYLIGFDCAHAGDLMPSYSIMKMPMYGIWRDEKYVTKELESLTDQLNKTKE